MAGYEWIRIAGIGQRVVLTRDFFQGWFFRRAIRGGTVVVVTRHYTGFLGGLTHVDVRNPADGQYCLVQGPDELFPSEVRLAISA